MDKRICKRCVDVQKVASFRDREQVGDPAPWKDTDEANWELGGIACPHRRITLKKTMAMESCLYCDEQKAIASGVVGIEEEQEI